MYAVAETDPPPGRAPEALGTDSDMEGAAVPGLPAPDAALHAGEVRTDFQVKNSCDQSIDDHCELDFHTTRDRSI